ncbi:uncharacterized protein LOC108104728 [Drosophila eugracilis]|uniref:uncharacterized protein LOC108104728 n=1 Tax=Drosophila eugracilis TaxID=29029 RepID=UPI0007E877EF|nr:uncharacterized protein LOC108104728 [Drosophila eugracilis]
MGSGLNQLLYGTALLTTIMVAPLVTLQFQLGGDLHTARFRFSGVVSSAIVSLVLTAAAMAPYTFQLKYPKISFLAMLPWICVCLAKFAMNVSLQLNAISHVANGTKPNGLVFALVAYCAIFGLALEQMLHWKVIYHLMSDGIGAMFIDIPPPRAL